MNFISRWRRRRELREVEKRLAELIRQRDRVCNVPGRTTAFIASTMDDLSFPISMAIHQRKLLKKELHHEEHPDSDDGDFGRLRGAKAGDDR